MYYMGSRTPPATGSYISLWLVVWMQGKVDSIFSIVIFLLNFIKCRPIHWYEEWKLMVVGNIWLDINIVELHYVEHTCNQELISIVLVTLQL